MGQRAQREEASTGQEEGAEDRGGKSHKLPLTWRHDRGFNHSLIHRVKTTSQAERKSSQGVGWIHRFVFSLVRVLRESNLEL